MVGGHAQLVSVLARGHLVDHTVNFEGVRGPRFGPRVGRGDEGLRHLSRRFGFVHGPICRPNARILEPHQQRIVVVVLGRGFGIRMLLIGRQEANVVGMKHEIARVGFAHVVLLAQSTRGEVPRVWRDVAVFGLKHRQGHHDLAAHVCVHGHREALGNVGDFARVSGDVLAAVAAAARGRAHKPPAAVFQGQGGAVQFWLGQDAGCTARGLLDEMHQVGVFGSLVEAAHREAVVHFDRARFDLGTDTLELRMIGCQLLQFVPQRVESGVADFRGRGVVVQVGVAGDFLGQPRDARRVILRRSAHA